MSGPQRVRADAGATDAGAPDAGTPQAGTPQAGTARVAGHARRRRVCLAAGLTGLVLTAAVGVSGSPDAWQGYLLALTTWTGLSLGALGLSLIHGATGGRWGGELASELDAAVRTLPLVALLFLLLLLGLDRIFPWAGAEIPGAVVRDGQRWYLNAPFFAARVLIAFAVWLALGYLGAARHRGASALGLVIVALTASLAAVDWIGSLLPQFHSSGFGLMVVTGELLAAFALALLCVALRALRRRNAAGEAGNSRAEAAGEADASRAEATAEAGASRAEAAGRLQDLGSLQLVLVLAWAYLALMHFATIWVADLPGEIAWYLPRMTTSWRGLSLIVVALEFLVPFVLLLSRRAKRSPGWLAAIALMLLVGHFLEVIWLITPTLRPGGFALRWTDAAAWIGVGGLWSAAYLGRLGQRPAQAGKGTQHATV